MQYIQFVSLINVIWTNIQVPNEDNYEGQICILAQEVQICIILSRICYQLYEYKMLEIFYAH